MAGEIVIPEDTDQLVKNVTLLPDPKGDQAP
jgi:hypothetical protein